ncbi:MAG: polyprenyl synthetase family protein [Nitrospiria bacterium]
MSYLSYLKRIKPRLDKECTLWTPYSEKIPLSEIKTLERALKNGKRIRGSLVCLMNEALKGKIEEAIPRAIAIEWIQAASLIHDDYVDQDSFRRGKPALWTLEGSRKAVLLGDILFATAIQKMVEKGHTDGLVIAQAIATMAQGAYREPAHPLELAKAISQRDYLPDYYNVVIHLKTGALFGAAAKLGAISAKGTDTMASHAYEFGTKLGEAYQILDDLQDINDIDELKEDDLPSPGRLAALAPVFLYFDRKIKAPLFVCLQGTEKKAWRMMQRSLPAMRKKMKEEISVRISLALREIGAFPNNPYTRILSRAPFEMMRLK